MPSSLEEAIQWLSEVRGPRETGEYARPSRTVSVGSTCTLASYLGFSPFVLNKTRAIPECVVVHADTLHQMILDGKL